MKTQGVEEVVVELKQNMADTFAKMVERFPGLKRQVESDKGVKIYFCGGGFRGYGSILKHTHPVQPYPIPDIGGFTVSGKRFCQVEEMLRVNETQSGKIFGMSKRRREQFPAIAAVVQALVDAIPKISTVTFCAGGNRDGVLYVKLPQGARDQHPLGLLPGGLDISDAAVNQWVSKILSALPGDRVPEVVTDHLLGYLVKNTWINLGSADGVNAAKAIHNPLSGVIASLPGLTHEVQAVISLTLCARWGNSLGPVDKALFKNLQALLGEEKAWWCGYIGALLRSMAAIYPVFPQGGEEVTMDFRAEWSKSLGKKGKKEGVLLRYRLPGDVPHNLQEIEEYFEDCGKGLELEWKVETGRLY
jgi:retrograde regulation protein 2